ncbi:hypothetical protein AAVH_20897 [Aphelenchoides avenae]|nr:hypothetical protein AAVH_20897 [Aphelenchus avenae]
MAICLVSALMTSVTTVLCAGLELRSFVLYRRLNVALRMAHKDDFGLLVERSEKVIWISMVFVDANDPALSQSPTEPASDSRP